MANRAKATISTIKEQLQDNKPASFANVAHVFLHHSTVLCAIAPDFLICQLSDINVSWASFPTFPTGRCSPSILCSEFLHMRNSCSFHITLAWVSNV